MNLANTLLHMDSLQQDIQYAFRRLTRSPSFTAVAILTLALGIGANTAFFSVVNAVLLRPLPFPESDQLVGVFQTWNSERTVMSPPNYTDVRQRTRTLKEMAAFNSGEYTLTGSGDPVRVRGAEVSASFFNVLETPPLLGRTFASDENEPGKHRVVVLGYSLWQQRFAGQADVLNRTIAIESKPYTVIGVMPSSFAFPNDEAIWMPVEYDRQFRESRGAWYLRVIGRVKPGVSASQSAQEIAGIGRALEREYPHDNTNVGMTSFPLQESLVGQLRPALLIVLGAVGFVLLIACANVANLLLARALSRETELAVRTALGAGRGRLIRQLLTESLLLAAAGGAAGFLLGAWGSDFLVGLQPEGIPRLREVGIDQNVMMFTATVSMLTGLIFGAIPALQMTRGSLATALKEGGRGGVGSRGSVKMRGMLVVAEMALAVMLLAGAGLLIKSFARLQGVDPGFQPTRTLSFELSVPSSKYTDDAQISTFYDRLIDRVHVLPGVRSVGGVTGLPLTGTNFNISFHINGRPEDAPGQEPSMQVRVATLDYFRTMGIPLKKGRFFSEADKATSPQVVLLSESAVKEYFPHEDPLGKRITMGWGRGKGSANRRAGGEIVGIVGDVKELGLDEENPPEIYLPMRQWPLRFMTMVMRTDVPPTTLAAPVREAVHDIDANVPVSKVRTVEDVVAASISQPRFYMTLLAVFAAVALALAAIGIFGVMSYAVSERTREIGIRMALGAPARQVISMVVRQAMSLAGAGLVAGLVSALVLSRTMTSLLFQLSPTDPATFAMVGMVLSGVALAASYLPARRAARVDPMAALRSE
jgi:putative ABC transport system permease protein